MSASTVSAASASGQPSRSESRWFYAWLVAAVGLLTLVIVAGWNAAGGTADPTDTARALSRTTVVVDSAVLVLREGLECVLVLAAITAGLRGPASAQRNPTAIGGGVALVLSVVTWFAAVWVVGAFGNTGATCRPRPASRRSSSCS